MKLTQKELHYLAMNIVGKALEEELGWEFLFVNSDLKKNPQFVCIDKEKQKHFIIVRAILFGQNPDAYDTDLMQVTFQKAQEYNAKTYWAGVGLTHTQSPELPLEKQQPYHINFKGLLEIS